MKEAMTALLGSRKFLMTIVGLLAATTVFALTRHSPDALTPTAFVAFTSGLVGVLNLSIAHEDAAEKGSPSAVATTGSVNVSGGGGGGPGIAAPRRPMPSGGEYSSTGAVVPPRTAPRSFAAMIALAALAWAAYVASGCTSDGKLTPDARNAVQTTLTIEETACVIANEVMDSRAVRTFCRIAEAAQPEVDKLLQASRRASAMRAAAGRTDCPPRSTP